MVGHVNFAGGKNVDCNGSGATLGVIKRVDSVTANAAPGRSVANMRNYDSCVDIWAPGGDWPRAHRCSGTTSTVWGVPSVVIWVPVRRPSVAV